MFRSILSQARTAITSPAIKSSHYSKLAPRKYPGKYTELWLC